MDRREIKEKLQDLYDQIDHIIEIYGKGSPGYRERVKTEYTQLKKDLRAEGDKIETERWKNQASPDELAFYSPAISSTYGELYVRSGASANSKMMENLYAAQIEIKFYLNQLKEQKS